MTDFAGWGGPVALVASLRVLANSMDGSDGLFEPLLAGDETSPVLPYIHKKQTQLRAL